MSENAKEADDAAAKDFTVRFSQSLLKNTRAHGYVHPSTVARSLEQALRPAEATGDEFPRMTDRSAEQRAVQNTDEEQTATAEGFGRTVPAPAASYGKFFCERRCP